MPELTLSVPMPQLATVFAIIGLCLLIGRAKVGLLIGYFACLYWGYIGNMPTLIETFGGQALGQLAFASFGLMLMLAGMYFLVQPKR